MAQAKTPFCVDSADPDLGIELGFGGVIMHGAAMYSMVARAILVKMSNNDPSALKSVFAHFAGALIPGGKCLDFPLLVKNVMWEW